MKLELTLSEDPEVRILGVCSLDDEETCPCCNGWKAEEEDVCPECEEDFAENGEDAEGEEDCGDTDSDDLRDASARELEDWRGP